MKNRVMARRFNAVMGAPIVAAGIFLGAMVIDDAATAGASPTSDGQCSGMTMTSGLDGPDPNALTRAGQVGSASAPSASDGSMAVNCQPASHG